MNFGLNLYSIRNLVDTAEKFRATAHDLKAAGYDFIQVSGVPYDPELIKSVSEESGLPVALTHMPMDRILNDTDALMKEHELFGCRNIGLGMMPLATIKDEPLFKETVEKLNAAGEKMKKNGFAFFYHNHHYEFMRVGEMLPYDYMIENAPYINFTLDTYWLQYGGVSILEYVERMKGRIACVHLKDYRICEEVKDDRPSINPVYAPVGDGTLNFKAIINAMLASGTQHFIVEQDNAALLPDPLGEVTRSIRYLKANF